MIKAILLVLAALPILAQNPGPVYPTSTDPTGNACSGNVAYLVGPTGIVVTCQNGTYAPVSGSTGAGNYTYLSGCSGTNTIVCAGSPVPTTYTAMSGYIVAPNTTSGAATLNVSGLGAKTVYVNGVASDATHTITAALIYPFFYDGTNIQIIGTAVPLSATVLGSTAGGLLAAASLQGNTTKVQLAGTISGTGASLCTDANGNTTTSGCSSGGNTFVNYINGGITQTNDGTDKAFFTYAAPALPAGACYHFYFEVGSAGAVPYAMKVFVGATLVATPWAGTGGIFGFKFDFDYCNNAGVQNAQTLFYHYNNYNTGSGLVNIYAANSPSNTDLTVSAPTAVNWATGKNITITTNGASGDVLLVGVLISAH